MAVEETDDILVVCRNPGSDCALVFPGGGELALNMTIGYPTPEAIASTILNQINTASMPFHPIFEVLEILKALLDCVESVKDGVTQANPITVLVGLAECLPNLIEKLMGVVKLLPVYSLGATLRGMVCAILQAVDAVASMVEAVKRSSIKLEPMGIAVAKLNDVELERVYHTTAGRICKQYKYAGTLLGQLSLIFDIVVQFGSLAGVEIPAPDFSVMSGPVVNLNSDALDEISSTLNALRSALQQVYTVLEKLP